MNRKIIFAMVLLIMLSLACGLSGGDKADTAGNEAVAQTEPTEGTSPYTVKQVESSAAGQSPTQVVQEATLPTAEEQTTSQEGMTKETEMAMAESLTVRTDAPIYFRDDFDGEINLVDWESTYSFWVDEDVDEDDEEAIPNFSINQRRGVLRFDLNSPWLYLYHTYLPHTYQDIRIDIEVENKATTVNNVSLFCRSTDYGWYEFIATSGGYYSIMRYYEDGTKELARGGIRSIRFGKDKENVFTAICEGKYLTYMVNDVEIARVKDEEIPDGGSAGFNISAEQLVPVQVEVNWLEFSSP